MKYTFGTSRVSAERLLKINQFFNPYSSALLSRYTEKNVNCVFDLGCGPGFTSAMLLETTMCRNIFAFDKSGYFLKIAGNSFKNIVFIKHDITKAPFPAGIKPDLIYTRFLLSHLKNVVKLINTWLKELNTNGALIIEEVEKITTDNPVFKKYLQINNKLVASQGANLFVGKILSKGKYGAEILLNRQLSIDVPNSTAASFFYPNTVSIWKTDSYLAGKLSPVERKNISCKLLDMIKSKNTKTQATWKMRQLVLRT